MRRHQAGRLGIVFALIALLVIVVGGIGGTLLYGNLQLGAVGAGSPVVVTVEPGESLGSLADSLQDQGLINSATWFAAYARIKGARFYTGQYQVNSGMDADQLLAALRGPQYRPCPPVKLVIPEGFTVDQIANRVASTSGLDITRVQYLAAVAQGGYDAPFLSIRPTGDTSLEGFLFPATYTLSSCTTAQSLVQQQLNAFANYALPLLPSSAQTAYADLITGSIVQAEARFADDFPLVASVVDNRLAAGMRLQIDSVVMYGLHMSGTPMTAADEAISTPYNTYMYTGLPPTPIDNPGVATLDGALHPAQTDYLYYVTDACGHNHYSATAAEHNAQVSEYLNSC